MFEEPSTKRIRRSEAFTDPAHFTPTSESNGLSKSNLPLPGLSFEYEELDLQSVEQNGALPTTQRDEETFEFPLFAPKSASAIRRNECPKTSLARINIKSPTPSPALGEAGFVVPFRPASYYFTASTAEVGGRWERKCQEFGDVAISGEEVLSRARSTAWPGATLAWRVIQLPASSLSLSLRNVSTGKETPRGITRKNVRAGKRRRIAIRKKYATEAEVTETEKEKRARRNREKKLKKREKNRKMKQQEAEKVSEPVFV